MIMKGMIIRSVYLVHVLELSFFFLKGFFGP